MCIIDSKKRAVHLVFKKGGPGNLPIKGALSTSITLASIETKTEGFRGTTLYFTDSCQLPSSFLSYYTFVWTSSRFPLFTLMKQGRSCRSVIILPLCSESCKTCDHPSSCEAAYIIADTYLARIK